MTNIKQPKSSGTETILAQHADAIRALGKRVIGDIIEIGQRLTDAKQIAGHGNWLPWLEREFGWTEMTATRFINVYEMGKSNKLLDLDVPVSGLYMLAAPGTPDEAREAVIARAESGERLSVKDVRNQIETSTKTKADRVAVEQPKPMRDVRTAADRAEGLIVTRTDTKVEARSDEFNDLIAAKAPGWTGAIVGTQREVDAAIERLRDDDAPGHWLVLAPRERVVVDHRVIQWLLLTAPALPVIVHIEWAFAVCGAANKARCPVWVSERLTGKPRPQRAGMTWPRELPIPLEAATYPAFVDAWHALSPEDQRRFLNLIGAAFIQTNKSDPTDIIGDVPDCLKHA